MSRAPSSIGRYSIVEVIGRGGMGALYLAWDPKLERQIAIKVLKEDIDELRERFAREARSAARLRHPHIVTIFELGEHDGQPYIAMEYIRGRTLAQIIRDGGDMPLGRTLEWMAALSDGLAFAHRAGIVHRDVKPANIMVDEQGSLKILDFGIARLAESSGFTQTGMMMGTLNYMSPEQVSGMSVDHRSDIFAVGLVFYELLTQKEAFPGTVSTGLLGKLMHSEPVPLVQVCPGLDEDVVRIVGRAIEKDINRRYQNLTEMRREILGVLRRVEAIERQPPATEPPAPGPASSAATPLPSTPPPAPVTPLPRPDTPPAPVTPPSTASPARPDSDRRSAIAQRRASQIQQYLDDADLAMTKKRYEAVIVACEHVLVLDAENARALDLEDRARATIEAVRAEESIRQAELRKEVETGPSRYVAIAAAGLVVLVVGGYSLGLFRSTAPDATTPKTQSVTPAQPQTPPPEPTPTRAPTPTQTLAPEPALPTPTPTPVETPPPVDPEDKRRKGSAAQRTPVAPDQKSKAAAKPVAPELPRAEQPGKTSSVGPGKTSAGDKPAVPPAQAQAEPKPGDDKSAIAALLARLGSVLSTDTNRSRNINDVLAVWPGASRNVFSDNDMQQYLFRNPVFVRLTAEAASVDCDRASVVQPRSTGKTSMFTDSVRLELRKTGAGWQVMSITQR